MKRKKMVKKRIISLFLAFLMVISAFANMELSINGAEDDFVWEISSFKDLMGAVKESKTNSFIDPRWTIKLMNDIEITEEDLADIKNGVYGDDIKSVTFGHQNKKFGGILDGQGYTISGLTYDANELGYAADTGLFSYTDGAVIKNLVLKDAHIDADYRGGFIVGSADNTTFENIVVQDSYMRVSCSNNVLTLVTDGGLVGGAIAGEAVNCVFYNCESNNTRINNNNTAGVAALGGKGLYLGGIVGTADDHTLIEYSRVIGGEVTSHYDVAVGALGGNTLYVGGIAGQLQKGSQVIDCFATPYLYYYAATYVSVGAGNGGHVGGIVAAAYGSSCEIERCHFAGTMESKQYNAVLVIPIIQNNINLSAIVDKVDDSIAVYDSYYRASKTGTVNIVEDAVITSEYGPKDDETYVNRSFWEGQGYDFVGNISRNTKYSEEHSNKWVMDYEQGIPVHGISVAAAFDFPGAGSVTIGPTTLVNTSVTTKDAYNFAVQAVNPREINPQTELTAALNEGYHFYGWYKESHYLNSYVGRIGELEAIAHDPTNNISQEQQAVVSVQDNDLFVACMKAEVKFYNPDGTEITEKRRDYAYEEGLDDAVPEQILEGAKFYGWTTVKSSEPGGGYSAITSVELKALETAGELYFTGDPVKKAMDLYPIYTNYITNIRTVFEGNELDSLENNTLREGVGRTEIVTDAEGNVYIQAVAEDGTTAFPDGYRFLGWYETQEDGIEVLISTDPKYQVSDLTKEVTYTAKFEYRVDYYTRAYGQDDGNAFDTSSFYTAKWHKYKEAFQNIGGPIYMRERVIHWGNAHQEHDSDDENCTYYTSENLKITAPLSVYSHNVVDATGGGTTYSVYMDTDFPGAGVISEEKKTASAEYTYTPLNAERYQLQFWTLERKNDAWTYIENPMNTGTLGTTADYMGRAMVTTKLVFHKKDGTEEVVTRRYEDFVLMQHADGYENYYYKYPHYATDTEVDKNPEDGSKGAVSGYVVRENSPENASMEIEGYAFLGWISNTEAKEESDEWNYIYDLKNQDLYCTSDPSKVQPYLITEEDVVTETMDLYPVYAKYDVRTTTNIESLEVPQGVNKPSLPVYIPNPITTTQEKTGIAVITLTAEHNKTVVVDGQEKKYQLVGFTCETDGGITELLQEGILSEDGYSYCFTAEVEAGKTYLFTAVYEPVVVVYHLDDTETKMIVKNTGDVLGSQPEPYYENITGIENAVFAGWTNALPGKGQQWILDSREAFEILNLPISTPATVVYKSMDLYPVFIKTGIVVDSNIDDVITESGTDTETVRYIKKTGNNSYAIVAEEYPGYVFQGWYLDYHTQTPSLYSTESIHALNEQEFYWNGTITAVYTKSIEVRYHDLEGHVIYSVNVLESDKRTFVEKMGITQDGITVEAEVPVDTEAFVKIDETFAEDQTFIEWQWWDEQNGRYVSWEAFKDTVISRDMDLYPLTYQINFTAGDGTDYTHKMVYGFLETDDGTIGLNSVLTEKYDQESLKITIEEVFYDITADVSRTEGIEEIVTNVYMEILDNQGQSVYKIASNGEVITDLEGVAVHYFSGYLKIRKTYQNTSVDDIVIVNVQKKGSLEPISIPIEVKEGVGEISLKLPAGTYVIFEDSSWSWRDGSPILEEIVGDEENSSANILTDGEITVGVLDTKTVRITNKRITNQWFSDTDRRENVFKSTLSGGK